MLGGNDAGAPRGGIARGEAGQMDGPALGWRSADQLFGPARSYLPDDDIAMGWLYKARALIGVAILIAAALHYHQGTRSIAAYFNPVLGGVTEPMLLALFSVVPATAAVVLFTRPDKRDKAFRQMVRYPGLVALICLGVYLCIRLLEQLASLNNPLIAIGVIIIGGLICLRFILFPFRAIYLITVGMCRLGDGHPLLPPIIGTILAWVVAGQGLLAGHAGTGEPAVISLAVLVGGPLSITALGHVEVSRLRAQYPDQFPFRDGPLSSPDDRARAASAASTMPPAASTGQHPDQPTARARYPWRFAVVSTIVLGLVGVIAAYAWNHFATPRAVNTALSSIQNGQCIQYRPDQGTTVESLPVIPCSATHWGQFLGLFSIGDPTSTPYPGDAAADRMSDAVCTKAFSQAVGSNPRDYVLWYRRPSEDGWTSNQWSNALCIAEASDSMPFEGSLSQQPEPVSPARAKVKPVPLRAVSLSRNSGYSLEPRDPTAAPHAEPLTTASALPPAPCGATRPSAGWFGDSGADADYQVTQGTALYADISVTIAPLTSAGEKHLPGYLRNLPSTCYSPHWFSFQDGMNYSDDGSFTRPADGTRLLDMGYGQSGSASYLEYWTVSDGYLLDFLYAPSTSVTSAREPMRSALAATVRHVNSVLHTHLRA
jgi:hypothetical protein